MTASGSGMPASTTHHRTTSSRVATPPAMEPPSASRAVRSATTHVQPAQGVAAVRHAAGRHRVGDQADRLRPDEVEQHPHGLRRQVHAVADDLEHRLAPGGLRQAGGHRAGRPVVQRRHAVEHVRDQRSPAARRGLEGRPERRPRRRRRRSRCAPARAGCRASPAARAAAAAPGAPARTSSARPRRARRPTRRPARTASTSAGSTSVSAAGFCAPRRSWERNGPSRWMPARSPAATRAAQVRTPDTSSSRGGRDQAAEQGRGAARVVVADRGRRRVGVGAELAAGAAVAVDVDQAGQQGDAGPARQSDAGRSCHGRRDLGRRAGEPDRVAVHHQRAVVDDAGGGHAGARSAASAWAAVTRAIISRRRGIGSKPAEIRALSSTGSVAVTFNPDSDLAARGRRAARRLGRCRGEAAGARRRPAGRPAPGGGRRLRDVVLHGPGVRRAARAGRPRRDRRVRGQRAPPRPQLRRRAGDHPVRHDHRGHRRPQRRCAAATSSRRRSSPRPVRRSPSWPTGPSCCRRSTRSRSCRPGSPPPPSPCCGPSSARTWSAAIADARAVLAEDEAQCLAGVADAEQVTFVGRGWTIGLAAEAALKLRESAQFWTESYPAMEYRHGPVSIATAGRATWALGEVPPGLRGAGARHRSALREPRHRPARRAGAGAPALPAEGPAGRPRPRPPAAPDPVGRPAGGTRAEVGHGRGVRRGGGRRRRRHAHQGGPRRCVLRHARRRHDAHPDGHHRGRRRGRPRDGDRPARHGRREHDRRRPAGRLRSRRPRPGGRDPRRRRCSR